MNIADYGLEPHDCKTIKVGDRFGRITILGVGKLVGQKYKYRAIYRCDCGTVAMTQCGTIQIGTTRSCGCKNREETTKHGLWNSPLYTTWHHMLLRCEDQSSPKYGDYGARGITVCDRWHDMRLFHEDMAPTYKPGLTLDRINNHLGYSPENCEWRTPAMQARNKRNNIWVTINGRTQVLTDWCKERGVSYSMVRTRIKDKGWPAELALSAPPEPRKTLSMRGLAP